MTTITGTARSAERLEETAEICRSATGREGWESGLKISHPMRQSAER